MPRTIKNTHPNHMSKGHQKTYPKTCPRLTQGQGHPKTCPRPLQKHVQGGRAIQTHVQGPRHRADHPKTCPGHSNICSTFTHSEYDTFDLWKSKLNIKLKKHLNRLTCEAHLKAWKFLRSALSGLPNVLRHAVRPLVPGPNSFYAVLSALSESLSLTRNPCSEYLPP